MTHIGVTGHQSIPPAATAFVSGKMNRVIRRAASKGPVWGVTSLAVGADQMFAELVLQSGGRLHVIVPSAAYSTTFGDEADLERYDALLASATTVEHLNFGTPTSDAFLAAGRRVVDLSDKLLAVWDGRPSRGLGGTADVVGYAASTHTPVEILWPAGVRR